MALPKVSAVIPVPSEMKKTVLLGMVEILGGGAVGRDLKSRSLSTACWRSRIKSKNNQDSGLWIRFKVPFF
jgi:hypothetical protein